MLDVVDSQLHLFQGIDTKACLAVMDALGIQSCLIDEAWDYSPNVPAQPHVRLKDGFIRPAVLGGRIAAIEHPDRFKYLMRVLHRDPGLESVMRTADEDASCLAFRAMCHPADEVDMHAGLYAPIFRLAAELGRPVFVQTIRQSPILEPMLSEFRDCQFVIDHVGLVRTQDEWDDLRRLAAHPNLAVKWCHANLAFPSDRYPFAPMQTALKEAVDAFGAERVLWASDATMIRPQISWAEALFYVRECELLTEDERAWVLGRAARRLLGWPAPETIARINPRLPHNGW